MQHRSIHLLRFAHPHHFAVDGGAGPIRSETLYDFFAADGLRHRKGEGASVVPGIDFPAADRDVVVRIPYLRHEALDGGAHHAGKPIVQYPEGGERLDRAAGEKGGECDPAEEFGCVGGMVSYGEIPPGVLE